MSQMYELAITATGEVRDADGNLISSEPMSFTLHATEEQLRELGFDADKKDETP